ncbi:putative WD40 repeat protein [Paratrimastix pyriformis]|uniref:WD40 repeat protein n=1 Tax=Paratrimastix pyriformis TaxID=342808 RepID=A0ABQ8UMF2_9EUKA|nr:putative WD40 repeat protein [Paratrimastix pyriformis]
MSFAQKISTGRPPSLEPTLFSPDSKFFFHILGTQVQVIATATGAVRSVLSGHNDVVTSVILNPVNKFQVYTSSFDGTIRLWDYQEAIMLKKLSVGQKIKMMVMSPLKPIFYLLVASSVRHPTTRAYTEELVSVHASKLRKDIMLTLRDTVCMTLAPDGKSLAVVTRSSFMIYDLFEHSFERFFHPRPLTCLAFHPTEPMVATGDCWGHLTLWYLASRQSVPAIAPVTDPATGKVSAPLPPGVRLQHTKIVRTTGDQPLAIGAAPKQTDEHWHSDQVGGICFSPGGEMVLTVGTEGVLVMWQLATMQRSFLPRLGAPLATVSASPDGIYYALCTRENAVLMVHVPTNSPKYEVAALKLGKEKLLTGLVRDPFTGQLAINSRPGAVQFFDPATNSHVRDLVVVGTNVVATGDYAAARHRVEHVAFLKPTGDVPPVMVTLTRRSDPMLRFREELSLKFWEWNGAQYVQNTCVEVPTITSIACHPTAPWS